MSIFSIGKQMSQRKITRILRKVREGQFLIIACEGCDELSLSVKSKQGNLIKLFDDRSIYRSVSGWRCFQEDNPEKIISVKIDEAWSRCPINKMGCELSKSSS